MMSAKVSVIVPVYNTQEYIERCIMSILQQSYVNIELILIDDGSADGSLGICMKMRDFDNRIIVISQKNAGVSSARNLGVNRATGEYVTFVDSDDWIEDDAIENAVKLMQANQVDCVRTHYSIETGSDCVSRPEMGLDQGLIAKNGIAHLMNNLLLAKDNCFVPLLLIRKSVLDEHNIRFSTNLTMMEDVVFYCELWGKIQNLYVSNDRSYHYFWNQDSASKSIDRLIGNANSTIEVSGYLDQIIHERYTDYLNAFNLRSIHAIHLSLISSRIITATASNNKLTLVQVKKYVNAVHALPGFKDLVDNSDIDSLKKHLKWSVNFLVFRHYVLLYLALKLRVGVSRLRKLIQVTLRAY